jgi:hypothetical protein
MCESEKERWHFKQNYKKSILHFDALLFFHFPSSFHHPSLIRADKKGNTKDCEDARRAYTDRCLKSWVKYWDERVKRGIPLKSLG